LKGAQEKILNVDNSHISELASFAKEPGKETMATEKF